MLLLLCTLFLFFLVLHVPLYYFFVDSNRADKIATGPEVISPIWFLLHLGVAFEQLYIFFHPFLVFTHVTNIGIAKRTLPPPKEVGF